MDLDYYEITGLYDEIRRFYSMVGEESRYLRFLAAVKDPATVYERIWSCGGRTFLVLRDRTPLAVVDVVPCGEVAEAGLVVVDALQGKGYGTRIAELFAALLPRLGFDAVKAEVFRENVKALAIARKMGASISCRDVVCTVRLNLRRPAPGSSVVVVQSTTP